MSTIRLTFKILKRIYLIKTKLGVFTNTISTYIIIEVVGPNNETSFVFLAFHNFVLVFNGK